MKENFYLGRYDSHLMLMIIVKVVLHTSPCTARFLSAMFTNCGFCVHKMEAFKCLSFLPSLGSINVTTLTVQVVSLYPPEASGGYFGLAFATLPLPHVE